MHHRLLNLVGRDARYELTHDSKTIGRVTLRSLL